MAVADGGVGRGGGGGDGGGYVADDDDEVMYFLWRPNPPFWYSPKCHSYKNHLLATKGGSKQNEEAWDDT